MSQSTKDNKAGSKVGGVTGKGFKPGQSGNPKGRPKNPFPRLMREAFLDKKGNDTGKTKGQALIDAIYEDAMRSHSTTSRDKNREFILHYWQGKPRVHVEMSGPDEQPVRINVSHLSDDDLMKLHAAASEAASAEEQDKETP